MATIKFKFTDYRKNINGETYERTITNIPFNKSYDCIKARYVVFDRGSYASLTFDVTTNTFYYDAKCYCGQYDL